MIETLTNAFSNASNLNIFGIFVFIGGLLCLFGVWYEGKKDGFDDEKLFDLFLGSFFLSLILGKISYFLLNPVKLKDFDGFVDFIFTAQINPYVVVITFIYTALGLAKKWKWSPYRVLDIFALGLSFFVAIVSLGYVVYVQEPKYMFIFSLYILFYSVFSTLRNNRVKSGYTASIFLILTAVVMYATYGKDYLLFYAMLITIALGVVYFRIKKSMETPLSQDFISKMKGKLLSKDKRLAKEEEQLKKTDPNITYEDRESDNADVLEDVTEDMLAESHAMQLSIVQKTRKQVQKALSKIKGGTYGISDVSGKPIPQERLEAYPEATTLVDEGNGSGN